MQRQPDKNSREHNVVDIVLLVALGAFLLFKGFVTFFIEPLAAGPDVKAYLEPFAEILAALVTGFCAVSHRQLGIVLSALSLSILAVASWFFSGHFKEDFPFPLAPELFVAFTALLGFLLHQRTARPIYGDENV